MQELKLLAVAGNHLFVPVEALLTRTRHIARTVIVLVHVDEAVALAVLTGGERHAVDAAPRRVAHQVDTIVSHRFFHLFNMGAQVVNSVVVVDAAIFFYFVVSTKTVFDNKQRLLIAFVQFTQ